MSALYSFAGVLWADDAQTTQQQIFDLHSQGDYQAAYQLLVPAVEEDDTGLLSLLLGDYYAQGFVPGLAPSEACAWYKVAALKEVPVALDKAANCLMQEGSQDSITLSKEYYLLAAQYGHHISYCHLGQHYVEGKFVAQDIQQGVALCEQSAQQSSIPAMLMVVDMIRQLTPTSTSQASIEHWLSTAAQFGSAQARYEIAQMFKRGEGVPNDVASALSNYEAAASQGYFPAYWEIANIYANAPRDEQTGQWQEVALAKAYMWLKTHVRVVNDENKLTAQQQLLWDEINAEIPASWRPRLDKQIQTHLLTFHAQADLQ